MIEDIISRTTVPPARMSGPGPSPADLHAMFEAAAAAPDHGKLVPWRYLVIEGDGREALGRLFADGVRAAHADASETDVEKQRIAPSRAPLILIAIADIDENHGKIPPIEQIAAAAASVQNLLLAAHSLGYAAKWATGANAYSPIVRKGLGVADHEHILGILYIGSLERPQAPPPRPQVDDFTQKWPAP